MKLVLGRTRGILDGLLQVPIFAYNKRKSYGHVGALVGRMEISSLQLKWVLRATCSGGEEQTPPCCRQNLRRSNLTSLDVSALYIISTHFDESISSGRQS